MKQIVLPDLGEGIETATVAGWHRKVGDRIQEGEDLLECVTDKASFDVPATASGTITEIRAPKGTEIKIGTLLAVVDES